MVRGACVCAYLRLEPLLSTHPHQDTQTHTEASATHTDYMYQRFTSISPEFNGVSGYAYRYTRYRRGICYSAVYPFMYILFILYRNM